MQPADRTDKPPDEVPRRVWSGTALQVLGRFWGAGCTLAILWLASGVLTPAGFGRLTFYLALFMWLDALVTLGTGPVAVQRTAANPEQVPAVLAAARRIRLWGGVFGIALMGGGAWLFGEEDAGWILLASLYPLTHVLELSITVFRNRIAWGWPVAVRALASAMSLTFVALLASQESTQPGLYLVAIAAGSTLANVLLHLVARPHLPRVTGPITPATGVLRAALPLGLSATCAQTYFYVDNLFVRALEGDEALGHYNVGVRCMSWLIMLASYVSFTALPWFTRRHREGALGPAIARIGPRLAMLAGLLCGALWPWTHELLELFRPGFGAASPSLRWLLGASVAVYAGAMFSTGLVVCGEMVALLKISAVAVLLNLVGNALAIPALGIEGAGLTTFGTELFVAASTAWVLWRRGVSAGSPLNWLGAPTLFLIGAWLSSMLPLG